MLRKILKNKITKYGLLALGFVVSLVSGKIEHDELLEELREEAKADTNTTESKEEA